MADMDRLARRNEIIAGKLTTQHETTALVASFMLGGGKVKKIPCTGKTPRDPRKGGCILGDATAGRSAMVYGSARRGSGLMGRVNVFARGA
jgi:hypothetical protein